MNNFLITNSRFWERHRIPTANMSDKFVMVDLLVTHPGYFMGNCIMAKILQKKYGYKLVGILPSSQNAKPVRAWAYSYGFHSLLSEDDILPTVLEAPAQQVLKALDGLSGGALRKAILDLEFDSVPVGDLIYDGFIRQTLDPTITELRGPSNQDGFVDTLPPGREPGWVVDESCRERWDLRLGSSLDLLPGILNEMDGLKIFLHDSEHTYSTMIGEMHLTWDFIEEGGYLICDNLDCNTSFFDFCRNVDKMPFVCSEIFGEGIRFGLIRK